MYKLESLKMVLLSLILLLFSFISIAADEMPPEVAVVKEPSRGHVFQQFKYMLKLDKLVTEQEAHKKRIKKLKKDEVTEDEDADQDSLSTSVALEQSTVESVTKELADVQDELADLRSTEESK